MLTLLTLIAMVQSPPQLSATSLLEEAMRATKQLDECLMGTAEGLRPSTVNWLEKYRTYRQSCGKERTAAFDLHLRHAWAELTPRNPDERAQAYRRATSRVDSRYDVWVVKFLDPKAPTD